MSKLMLAARRPLAVAAAAPLAAWMIVTCCCVGVGGAPPPPPVRAVNLGGWLVVEGWMKPSPFDAISADELLDGTQIWIKSPSKNNAYLSASNGGTVVANKPKASSWETFKIWRRPGPDSKFRLRRADGHEFVGLGNDDNVVAKQTNPNDADEFEFQRSKDRKVRIKARNGKFLQVIGTSDMVTADYGSESTSWDDSDPSVFVMEIQSRMTGEFQLCNFYGLDQAQTVLQKHWDSFIVKQDFSFMSSSGLNAVRIPVAWWITQEQGSPGATDCRSPFYQGYLETLDKAFNWATKYNLGVILDLHAAPGSQNGNDHSGSREGSVLWPSDANVQDTVAAIRALAKRYGSEPSLLAIELLNEPAGHGIPLATLASYYDQGYHAVREHAPDAYVIMSARLSSDPPEILARITAAGYRNYVVDVHYYNLYDNATFGGMTLDDNVRYVKNRRPGQLAAMMQAADGPPVLVGEWAAEWMTNAGASDGDYGRMARAQLDVFGNASFGWAYWTYRNDDDGNPGWSLKEMMQRGIMPSF